MPVACGGVAVVLRLQTPELVPLRASVGSTDAAKDGVARVGPTTPTRAKRLADASVDHTEARNSALADD